MIDDLEPPQIFDVHIAFVAWQKQTHWIAVTGHQPLAILIKRYQGVIERLLTGTLRLTAGASALGDHPLCLRIDTGFLQQRGKLDPVHSAQGDQTMQFLNIRLYRLVGK